ncbi:MAG: ferritin-like domain-containing protein [Solirubrobacteraceae bacterium]
MVTRPAPGAVPATSRRSFVRTAVAAAAAGGSMAVAAGCSTRRRKPAPVETPGAKKTALQADVALLNSVLDLEHRTIAAYTAGIPLLSGEPHAAAQLFLDQEFEHAAELAALIHQGGGKPNLPSPSYVLGNPRSQADVLHLLHRIERDEIAAYLDALPMLTHGIVRSTIASILANEAEHISFVRGALGRTPVPQAFVTAAE